MIFDENPEIRRLGFQKRRRFRIRYSSTIPSSRFQTFSSMLVRPLTLRIYINFRFISRLIFSFSNNLFFLIFSEHYYKLIDWRMPFTEPPFTKLMPYENIKILAENRGNLENDISRVPCHIQTTERHIKDVTRVSQASAIRDCREAAIAVTLESRKNRPKFESKKDYQLKILSIFEY